LAIISDQNDDRDERARRRAQQREKTERARQRFRQQEALQANQPAIMAQQLDAAAVQALIDAAVNPLQAQRQQAQQDLVAANNQIQVLQAAALQVQLPPPAPIPIAPATQFAYGPGAYGLPTDLIDYKTTTGAKIQKAASEKLDIKFNLEFEHLFELLEQILTQATANNWTSTIFAIMRGQLMIIILDHYGTVTEAEILAKLQSYMFQNLRATQDLHNAFQCLEATLTPEARLIVYAERHKYTIRRGDVPNAIASGDPEERRRDGLMFLWCILNRTTAKTNATIANIVR
jgi:hypothetical protein